MIPAGPGADADLVTRCAALGDETRWAVLKRVGRSPASASTLAAELPVSRQAIARHLEVLRAAGLVEVERQGREVLHRALGSRLSAVADDLVAVAREWEHQLAALKQVAESRAAERDRSVRYRPDPSPESAQAGPSEPAG